MVSTHKMPQSTTGTQPVWHRCMDTHTSPKTSACHLGQVWAAVYQGAIKVLICLSKRISMFVKWSSAHRCTMPANKKEKEEIYKKLLVQCRHISYCWDQVFKKLWACPSVWRIVESSVYGFTTKIGGCSSSVNRRRPWVRIWLSTSRFSFFLAKSTGIDFNCSQSCWKMPFSGVDPNANKWPGTADWQSKLGSGRSVSKRKIGCSPVDGL